MEIFGTFCGQHWLTPARHHRALARDARLDFPEAATRLSDLPDPVPDEIWDEAARHYDEPALATLILNIALINAWNRLNVTTRQVAGEWAKSADAKKWVESRSASRWQHDQHGHRDGRADRATKLGAKGTYSGEEPFFAPSKTGLRDRARMDVPQTQDGRT